MTDEPPDEDIAVSDEDIAVPDEDIVAETLEGVGDAVGVLLTGHDEPRPRLVAPAPAIPPGPEVVGPGMAPPPVTEGPPVPGPPPGIPPEPPPPDPGYYLGSDMPFGIGEDSPANEGSEDTAAPPIDPAEYRFRD